MSNFKLNLPTDIPWKRKCVSEDMLDIRLGDAKAPYRWRSSIAIFEYEPEDDSQNYDGMVISYLKVVCTITGYQVDPEEIGVGRAGMRSYWNHQPGIVDYLDKLAAYYACYGAVLEVTVGPESDNATLGDFPFFMDFEPKKRELYQMASDTQERQSRSIESLNLTKSAGRPSHWRHTTSIWAVAGSAPRRRTPAREAASTTKRPMASGARSG